ncbi:beta strand repeat-containing protein [Allorhodopirellula solitaria]|nr:choice-of-anchor Q domain-containing protein [Allorhodopirellula solitaria]
MARRVLAEQLEDRRLLAAYVVDTSIDAVDATDGVVSLREAIQAANTNAVVGDAAAGESAVPDAITFADGLSTITLNSQLAITEWLAISLGDAADVTISGNDLSRIFYVDTEGGPERGDVSISGLTLTGGSAESGGAIYVPAGQNLTLDSVTLMQNVATGSDVGQGGGAIYNAGQLSIRGGVISENAATGTSGSGGGVLNDGGRLTVENGTVISDNRANRAGGGIETVGVLGTALRGDVILDGVTLQDNTVNTEGATGNPGNGGGLHITGSGVVTISGGEVTGNSAVEGGGLWNSGVGTLSVTGATISGNTASGDAADNGGGGVFNDGGITTISGGTISDNVADGTSGSGGGVLNNGGTLTIDNGTILSGNRANRAGGGIETAGGDVTLDDVILRDNTVNTEGATGNPGNGGGLHIGGEGVVAINGGEVTGNSAVEGGGLWNSGVGTLSVTGTTISGNTASGDAADNGGGGVFNNGGVTIISGGTISDNVADGTSGSGGGVLNNGGTLTIDNGTILSGNRANRAGGGIETAGGDVTLDDVILRDNTVNTEGATGNPGNGGGLHIGGDGVVMISGGEVTGNSAVEGGGLWNSGAGVLNVDGTLIADNTAVRGGGVYQQETATTESFTVDLDTLNGAYGSTASGTATITLDTSDVTGPESGTATIRVQINATGLPDLTDVEGGIHVAHIHGQFAGNADRPAADQGDGPFFDGEGGAANGFPPSDSTTPTTADDGANNIDESGELGQSADFLDFFEGRPDYGPVVLNLSANQLDSAPDGTPPLTFFFEQLAAGNIDAGAEFPVGTTFNRDTTYTFDLSDADARRQYNNLTPLDTREIVLHGLVVPTEVSDAIDAATGATPGSPTAGVDQGDGTSFRRTAPIAAGKIGEASGMTTITDATITGNTATGDLATEGGGGIYNEGGTLNVSGSTIASNAASGTLGSGGGIFSLDGEVSLNATTIGGELEGSGNTANRAGGGIEVVDGQVSLEGFGSLSNNFAGINGGGVHITGAATVDSSQTTYTDNTAASEGGGLWNSATGTINIDGGIISDNVASGDEADNGGGGIFNDGGLVTTFGGVISDNVADGTSGSGGGVLNDGGTLEFGNGTILSGNRANRAGGGIETAGGDVTLDDVILRDNTVNTEGATGNPGNGGGLHIGGEGVVAINGGEVTGNSAVEGGGLWNSGVGTLSVTGATISGNTASGDAADNGGGGVFNNGGVTIISGGTISDNVADGTSGSGGGVLNNGGTLTIDNGTILSGNRANRAGGGIETAGGDVTLDDVILRDNTVNTEGATGNPGNGGGLHIGGEGVVMISGGEVTGNSAVEGGGLWNSGAGVLNVDGTLIADNTAVRGGGVYQQETATTESFTVDLDTLNGAYGSTATGTATITLDTSDVTGPESGTATIRVQINATGLPDLTDVEGGIHVAHIHGQFAGNADRPAADQGDGPFFDGEGGTANGFPPSDSTTPTTADDGANNIDESGELGQSADFLDFFEGRPDYGPVVLNLSANQLDSAPDGTPPLTFFFEQLAAGNIDAGAEFPVGTTFNRDTTYTFDLSDADARRQYNNLTPLDTREIVLHGLVVPTEVSDAIDAATGATPGSPTAGVDQGDGTSFRRTAPIAAGKIGEASGMTTITDATITGNTATGDLATEGGGGIYNEGGTLNVSGSTIASNAASGTLGSGGGIFSLDGEVSLNATTIGGELEGSGNTANRAGGGIEVVDGQVSLEGFGSLSNNFAGINGGGVHITGAATVDSSQTTYTDNTAASEGGGLWNSATGTINIDGGIISDNVASGDEADNGGGGIFNDGGLVTTFGGVISDNVADGTSGSGGGVLNDGGTLEFGNGTILSGNRANRAGGGIETAGGDVTLDDVILRDNTVNTEGATGNPGNGGGLHIGGEGVVAINGGEVTGNSAVEGGGLWNSGVGTLSVTGATISGNTASGDAADNGGGGVFNNGGVTIISGGTISDNVADGTSGSGGGVLNNGGTLTIDNGTILSGNRANRAGGGIETAGGDVTLDDVILRDNTVNTEGATGNPGNGGGLHIGGEGVVTITNSTVTGNSAVEGGGLWNSGAGTLTVDSSTVADNAADDGGGVYSSGTDGDITVTNSTIAGNTAINEGGGIASEGGNVVLTSVTIAENSAATGGGIQSDGGIVSAINALIASNTASTGPDIAGELTSNGNNLVSDTTDTNLISASTSDLLDVDARLESLADNGGPTQTIALQAGSPALGAGVAAGLTVDQRGVARPQGNGIDIGAYESALNAPGVSMLSISPANADRAEGDTGSTPLTFTVTRSGETSTAASVDYTVSGSGSNPANAGDFVSGLPVGTIDFVAGQTSQVLTIEVSGDRTAEQDEGFTVTLSNASAGAAIAEDVASGVIRDDDRVDGDTRIVVPTQVVRPHVIPGDGVPTAIIFQAVTDATVTVFPVGIASVTETVWIVDGDTLQISEYIDGAATAEVTAGGLYSIIFEPQSEDRIFSVRSSAGIDSLSNEPATNIVQPTDTSANGETTALDALRIINALNQRDGASGEPLLAGGASNAFLDVNRDSSITALDALVVINYLNRQDAGLAGNPSGESLAAAPQQEFSAAAVGAAQQADDSAIDQAFAGETTPAGWSPTSESAEQTIAASVPAMTATDVDAALEADDDDADDRLALLGDTNPLAGVV